MLVIAYTEARKNFASHWSRVVSDCDVTGITRQNAEPAVLMSLREYESWIQTMHLLRGKNGARLPWSVDNINSRRGHNRR